jgi:4-amino-4-deoxy-L-arabinose transferase-like glycosyltransferase
VLPLALMGSAVVEAAILSEFPGWSRWLTPLVVALCLVSAATLAIARLGRRPGGLISSQAATVIVVLALLVPMAVWSAIPVWHGGHTGLPYAGPDLLDEPRESPLLAANPLVNYLLTHRRGESYLAATLDARTAAPIILATGEPVMAMGGFSGGDPILNQRDIPEMVADSAVRFFLLTPQARRQDSLSRWVNQHCAAVPPEEWGIVPRGKRVPLQLFDCAARCRGLANSHPIARDASSRRLDQRGRAGLREMRLVGQPPQEGSWAHLPATDHSRRLGQKTLPL